MLRTPYVCCGKLYGISSQYVLCMQLSIRCTEKHMRKKTVKQFKKKTEKHFRKKTVKQFKKKTVNSREA
jgi:hypothetical protein